MAKQLYAHYTATTKQKTIRVTDSNRPVDGLVYTVSGKKEARLLMTEIGSKYGMTVTAWNF